MAQRERWGTKIGLILAMAGNAVGLGNFLRFPVQAAQNGGGAFMIPYFVAFLLLGIPLMWLEWGMGRYGGKYGHGSAPGMFDVMWKNPISKYIGAAGLFISTVILIYYTYIESWTLGFSFFSLTKAYFGETTFAAMGSFLSSYQGTGTGYFGSIGPAYIFMCITFLLNIYVLYRGISKGIEMLAKIAMPALIIFALILLIRVITIGTPDPTNHPDWNIASGFAFIWNPDFSKLSSSAIWLAAAGQIFFTLSVGLGCIQAYASYIRENEDLALGGLATAATNEFVEVIFGGSIAIPVAVAFFGVVVTQQIAAGGAFNLGFVSMPIIFQKIPFGQFFGFLWFLLLFFAGITSSVALAQPLITFLKDEFKMSQGKATAVIGATAFIGVQFVIFFLGNGFLDEMDYWAGTFGLAFLALFEVIIFAWIFGMDKGWAEITRGAEIKIPKIFYYIIKYVTPVYLLFIFINWLFKDAIPILLMRGVKPEDVPYRWGARFMMLAIFIGLLVLVGIAWKRKARQGEHNEVKS
jgi:NSS family neurotransmitter:Na+ symporter